MLYLIITEPFLSLHFPVTPESHLFDAAGLNQRGDIVVGGATDEVELGADGEGVGAAGTLAARSRAIPSSTSMTRERRKSMRSDAFIDSVMSGHFCASSRFDTSMMSVFWKSGLSVRLAGGRTCLASGFRQSQHSYPVESEAQGRCVNSTEQNTFATLFQQK